MNYFKNEKNEIFAYDDEQVKQGYGKDLTPITEDERNTILAPTQSQLNAQRVSQIDARLKAIDVESVRPLRAISNGVQTQFDTDKLSKLDAESDSLRKERATLVTT